MESDGEPLATVMQLAEDFGNVSVIAAITASLAIEVDEDRCCVLCARKAKWLRDELLTVLDRFEKEFRCSASLNSGVDPVDQHRPTGAVARINSTVVNRVQ
jgi:hypothetical protein